MKTDAPDVEQSPWYHAGLRFTCTRCGDCCTGEPGFVWVDDEEIEAIATLLQIPQQEMIARDTRWGPRGRTLRERVNGDCIYYQAGRGCTIYSVRPRQCRTWPFWESNVATPSEWKRTEGVCPGAGRGELIPAEEITRRLKVIAL